MKKSIVSAGSRFLLTVSLVAYTVGTTLADLPSELLGYPVVDTGQATVYDDAGEITAPAQDEAFYGQDAQFDGIQPDYTLSNDGLTVLDNTTGLMWQQSPDANGDGVSAVDDKRTWSQMQDHVDTLNAAAYGGHTDWRLPSIKELYSLIDFRGTDPRPEQTDTSELTPFIDTDYFGFAYGDTSAGERVIDSQWASSTLYVADNSMVFGVNFADGRIKGYGMSSPRPGQGDKTFFVQLVRGNPNYGTNDFIDNGDDTVTDQATGLTWMQQDSMGGMVWQDALDYCAASVADGQDGWRLPNAKELQSIVDYRRSPDTSSSAAIDPIFSTTVTLNEDGVDDFPYYWTSTTHIGSDGLGAAAVYVAFGRSLGLLDNVFQDVHGAGSQRSDPKYGTEDAFPQAFGPQGDIRRVFNYVRCVRGGADESGGVEPLVAAVLPASRSVQVGTVATAFATIINVSGETATNCGIHIGSQTATALSFWVTNPHSNLVVGEENQGAEIGPGESQSYLLALTPSEAFQTTEIELDFACDNLGSAAVTPGVNTLLMSSSTDPTPDVIALAATLDGDGIVDIPDDGDIGVLAVASLNLGAGATVTASADTGSVDLPVSLRLCETDPESGQCPGDVAGTVTTELGTDEAATFGIFVTSSTPIALDPAVNRVFVRFTDEYGAVRGATSVAVTTE